MKQYSFHSSGRLSFGPQGRKPDHTDEFDDRLVLHNAGKHYGVNALEIGGGMEANLDSYYKPGLLAKRHLSRLGLKSKAEYYDVQSAETSYCISSASALVAALKDIHLTLVWDAVTFSDIACPDLVEDVWSTPSIKLYHSIVIGNMPMIDVARLADIITMCSSGVPADNCNFITDDGELYLSVISLDARINLLTQTFSRQQLLPPWRFHLGTLTDPHLTHLPTYRLPPGFLNQVRILPTLGHIPDKVPLQSVSLLTMESSNPLFDPDQTTLSTLPPLPPRTYLRSKPKE